MSRSDGSTADYYVLPEGATQLQDLISHRNLNAQLGEIFRACYRYGLASHSDMLRDAKKIRFYAQAEVDRLEKLQGNSGDAVINTITLSHKAFDKDISYNTDTRERIDLPVVPTIWDMAPVGATHYTPETEENFASFWRYTGDKFVECWPIVYGELENFKNEKGYSPAVISEIQSRPGA